MEDILQALVAIVTAGVLAQWIAWRVGVPSILLLLAVGLLAGPGTGWLDPDALFGQLLLPVVSLSVAVILYEGGLSLRLRELRRGGPVILRLCTLGALVTWAGASLLAGLLFDLPGRSAWLVGALFIVTGPTVIGPLLRQIRPNASVGTALKWEGIVTDPLGVMVAVLVFESMAGAGHHTHPMVGVLRTLGIGGGLGMAGGLTLAFLLRRHLLPDHLQNPVSLMMVFAVFGLCERVQSESGLLAVTIMGIVLANRPRVDIRHIVEFKESLQVLLLAVLFVVLAARVDREVLASISWRHFLFLAGLVVLVRPAAVLASALGSAMPWPERFFLVAVAPRGIVAAALASVLALELVEAGRAEATVLVPLTFFVIVGTVLIYGLGSPPIARALGVAARAHRGVLILGAHEWARRLAQALQQVGADVLLVDSNRRNVLQGRLEGLTVEHENILAEGALEDLDLSARGIFLAMTSNDEVNALACLRMAEVFGRSQVYQLVAEEEREGAAELDLGGRRLFGVRATFPSITRRFRQGWQFKATGLSESFGLDDYSALYGEEALPLFVVTVNGALRPIDSEFPSEPREGQKLVGLVPPEKEPPRRNET